MHFRIHHTNTLLLPHADDGANLGRASERQGLYNNANRPVFHYISSQLYALLFHDLVHSNTDCIEIEVDVWCSDKLHRISHGWPIDDLPLPRFNYSYGYGLGFCRVHAG